MAHDRLKQHMQTMVAVRDVRLGRCRVPVPVVMDLFAQRVQAVDLVDKVVRCDVRVVAHVPFGIDLDGAGRVLVHAFDCVRGDGPDVVVEKLPCFVHLGRRVATVDGRVVVEASVELDGFAPEV